jgi:hypothetical protein
MKDVQTWEGTFRFDDDIADALHRLGDVLAARGQSARVRLQELAEGVPVTLTIGRDSSGGLRAKPASGDGSRLGLEDI